MTRVLLSLLAVLLVSAEPPFIAPSAWKSPADELATFKVPDGFEVQLVAAEPDIAKPINIAFDALGRLWVTSSSDYPYPAADGQGHDTVKILSDFGPDGRARKVETFADGLNIPIGVLPYKDGAIVYSIPNLWFFRDTDGDGKCDKREILYSGFGSKDTHGMVNGLTMGLDGWVYCNHGYANDSVVKGKDGSEIKMNSGNVFRVKPDGSRVELWARGQVNPFGSTWDEYGNLYTACCHSKPITLVLRGAVYESFGKPHDGLGFGPDIVHEYRGSTALCGLSYYDADYYPEQYRKRMFLGDVVFNCINIFDLTWKGATPTAKQQKDDFLKSSDPWFRPVDIKLGPDGALYFADFYNKIIGHYEVPLDHPGRDRKSGRIWRIVRKGVAPQPVRDLTNASVEELAQELGHPNIGVRFRVTNQLQNHGRAVAGIPVDRVVGAISPVADAHSWWATWDPSRTNGTLTLGWVCLPTSKTFNAFSAVHEIRSMIDDATYTIEPSAEVAQNASKLNRGTLRAIMELYGIPAVREPAASKLLLTWLPLAKDDPVLEHSIRIALRNRLAGGLIKSNPNPREYDVLAKIALGASERGGEFISTYIASREPVPVIDPDQARHVARFATWKSMPQSEFLSRMEKQKSDDPAHQALLLRAILQGFAQRGQATPAEATAWAMRVADVALKSTKEEHLLAGIEIAGLTGQAEFTDRVATLASDRKHSDNLRAAAISAVTKSRTAVVAKCLADATETLDLREKSALALGTANSAEARAGLVAALPTAPAFIAAAIAYELGNTKAGATALCDLVEKGQASPRLLQRISLRAKLDKAGLKERVTQLTKGLPQPDVQIAEVIRARRDFIFAGHQTDLAAGQALYTKHCAICHQIEGKGAKVGPQLDGIGVRGLDRLMEDTLDPNRNVDPSFRATTLQLTDGRTLTGLVLREVGETVVIADAQGKEISVAKANIESRTVSPLSAMPSDVAEKLPMAEFANLIGWLQTQGKK